MGSDKVSKSLQKKRFSEKYRWILHPNSDDKSTEKLEEVFWSTGDIRFIAAGPINSHRSLRGSNFDIKIHLYGYNYHYFTYKPLKTLTKHGSAILIRSEDIAEFQNFINQKPSDETLTYPFNKGAIHLSFKKRSPWGATELSWRFLYSQEEWDNASRLPAKERARIQKSFKAHEKREQLWFNDLQIRRLNSYLEMYRPGS